MTCPPLPTPEQRRAAVAERIDRTPVAERVILRARLYEETPAVGLLEEMGREPKCRCAVCWVVRPARLQWKDQDGTHRYTCESDDCRQLWRRLSYAEDKAHARAQERLVQAVRDGVPA
ncbi:hypothetical protein JQX13_50475 [Archangium violaceum]|uniref:hypothetical protein n=1 Tax=Archangium violaceum TaxID=83451 RepID=UPI00193B1C84|nr:hypothetical protein [Archangium violaceum]QRK08092.1 hypothetical protein JQX13_50475 [Archangium violaceum]